MLSDLKQKGVCARCSETTAADELKRNLTDWGENVCSGCMEKISEEEAGDYRFSEIGCD